ncbi:chemotaxis protein CheX [Planctomycetota bacterium]
MLEQICISDVLLESAKEVFETMIFMDIEKSSCEDSDVDEDWSLLGSITFKGGLQGCLAICFNTPCAQAIAINMLGMDSADELSEEDVCDAIGEVANMVMGSVKSRLIESTGNLEVSIPSVISGRQLRNNLGEHSEEVSVKINIEDKYVAGLVLLYKENVD